MDATTRTAERRMIMLKDIDLTNKCGSCCHFKPIEDTASGECLRNPYNDSVVHDPKHPHWIVQRSRVKCPLYNAKPQTNADRIRTMSNEELAEFLESITDACADRASEGAGCGCCPIKCNLYGNIETWLKQPVKENNNAKGIHRA